jgi:hypothetical protein
MENEGGRVFVVPVTGETVVKKPMSSNVQKTSTNELLSISKGIEVIK